jgi:putative ABC transport system permease protein
VSAGDVAIAPPRAAVLHATVLGPLRQTPGRTLLAIAAIALGVALGFSIYLINRVAADEVRLAASSLFGAADLAVRAPGAGFDEQFYPRLAAVPDVAVASPVVEVAARVPGHDASLDLIGIDAFRARQLQPALAQIAGPAGGSGAATDLLSEDSVWLSAAAAHELGLEVGQTLVVQVGLDDVRLRVAGLLPASEYRRAVGLLDIATAQWRLDRIGRLDRVDLRLRTGADIERVTQRIRALLPPGATVTTPGESGDDAVRLTRAYRSNLTALALVALFTGGFLVYATQALAVARRRREIALLHALGVTPREQALHAVAGGVLIGACGAVLGVLLGSAIARIGLATLGADLGAGFFRGMEPELDTHPLEWLAFVALGIVTAIVASVSPAHEAATVPAAAALKSGDEPPRAVHVHGRLALALLVVALLLLPMPALGGLPLTGYAAIAALLLAAVFATPLLTQFVLAHLPERGAAWRQIAVAQLRGTAARANLSIAAVLVSFSLMVAMAIMVASFRNSLDAWVQRILPADLYARVGSSMQTAYFDEEAQQAIARLPGVARIDFLRYVEVAMPDGRPLTIVARPLDDATASQLLVLQRVASRPAPAGAVPVWISEAAHDLHGLDVDQEFDLPLAGRTVRASVRGIWRDYEQRAGGAVIVPRERYVGLTADTRAATAAIWLERDVSSAQVAGDLRRTLARDDEIMLAEPREIRRLSLRAFDRTFAVTYLLEAVAVLIGLFGIAASTGTQVLARRAEFGMLRHLGVTRREIARMLAFEGAAQGALGAVTGLAVGAAISLVLIFVVNRQSFHWSMDLHVPIALLALLSVVLVAAAAATAVWSGRRAMSADVVQAVKEDW